MSGFRSAATAAFTLIALASFAVPVTPTLAANSHHRHHAHAAVGVTAYSGSDAYYDEGNEAAFPNTEDHSAECINHFRWQRHNHDWYKTTGQDTIPLPC